MTIVSGSPLRRALSRSARAVHQLYDEQAYAWDRLFWVGLPEPEQARGSPPTSAGGSGS